MAALFMYDSNNRLKHTYVFQRLNSQFDQAALPRAGG
jgi:hypothetical protein